MALVKSHSNYVLKSKHQVIKDGTIWERDITTIGGISDYPSGQVPVYNSGNFIISVRGDGGVSNKYTPTKWKANDSGDVWTVENVSGLASESKYQDDTKIVLKQDYYDFRDFAYYGSLTELMRASIGDILVRFPGELCYVGTPEPVTYTKYVSGNPVETELTIGGNTLHKISNPSNINLHSTNLPEGADPLKYMAANKGWEQYEYVGSASVKVTDITPRQSSGTCPGDIAFSIDMTLTIGGTITIYAYIDDDYSIKYAAGPHGCPRLRPKQEYIDKFYNECSNFQRLLVNPNTSPLYKATFSVIGENNFGYYRKLEDFVFPKADAGGYNIDASAFGFNTYTQRMAEIGEFYDEKFTDNLYRAMTHESIKNFDWTRSRKDGDDVDEDVLFGAERMKKMLRISAREFDEVKSYIDGIRNVNSVTYDERNNLPDYFLTDVLSDDGWDVKQAYPYKLSETLSGSPYSSYTSIADQVKDDIVRNFYQETKQEVYPYSAVTSGSVKAKAGYFILCDCSTNKTEKIESGNTKWVSGNTLLEDCSGTIRFKMRPYFSDKKYTVYDAGNQFLRNLKINSRHILRHKGTVEGIEMLLGLFGLKSKRWANTTATSGYDYDIMEYSVRTNRIFDPYLETKGMNEIDWYNSTKAIQYDYRSESDVNEIDANYYLPYQGLPVAYRAPYSNESGSSKTEYYAGETSSVTVDENSLFLYPHFSKKEKYDGDPYFQMNGGWFSKRIEGSGTTHDENKTNAYNFSFDVDNNIVIDDYFTGFTESSGNKIYAKPLYAETINSIRSVGDIEELLHIPSDELYDGKICYVDSIPGDMMVIDSTLYVIETEINSSGEEHRYIELEVVGGSIEVGDEVFTENISVYDIDGNETTYYIGDKYDGYVLKAYFNGSGFTCHDGYYTIGDWFEVKNEEDSTNYFQITDVDYNYTLAGDDGLGWERLKTSDFAYKRLMTITNYYKGNNPHSGLMKYDNGHEYLTYFKRLFKYAYDEDKFDERCFDDYYSHLDKINSFGFSGMVEDDEAVIHYDKYLIPEDGKYGKAHYFGPYKFTTGKNGDRKGYYQDSSRTSTAASSIIYLHSIDYTTREEWRKFYNESYAYPVVFYTLNKPQQGTNNFMADGFSGYSASTNDDVTDQVINTKRIKLTFNLNIDKKKEWFSQNGQCELKYIDDIIMNYVTQMIPSTAILEVVYYDSNSGDYNRCP